MQTLRRETWERTTLLLSTAWLLASCTEAKGKEELWTRQKPETVRAPREQARIQSVESSNRIEGVTVRAERLVEDSREEYYGVLARCSAGWQEGRNEIVPWWKYFLGVLGRAYSEFSRRVESCDPGPGKAELVRRMVLDRVGPFPLAEIRGEVPVASAALIKKVLARMKAAREVRLTGRGRGASWELTR